MSVDMLIRQRGFLGKPLPKDLILGGELNGGCYGSGGRLEESGELNLNDFTCYLPDAVGRGISVFRDPKRKREVELRLLTPTCTEEIRAFYRLAERIARYWHGELEVDGNRVSLEEWLKGQEAFVRFNTRALEFFCREELKKEDEEGSSLFFSARWPLYMGAEEARRFLGHPERFDAWLHERQTVEAYYAVPGFFEDENGGKIGRYVLPEGCRSILPRSGQVPFGVLDDSTGKPLECESFELALYSDTEKRIIGCIPYEQLPARFPAEKLSRYDARCVLLEPLDLNELRALADSVPQR